MFRSPWFTLVLGLMVGLVFGYVLAEQQAVPPGKALKLGMAPGAAQGEAMPEGHPPVDPASAGANQQLRQQVEEIQGLLAANPEDPGLMAALGNVFFDAGSWADAKNWYEKSLAIEPGEVNVLTDLAVVYRNLQQPEKTIELLDQAIQIQPEHWQAWYNKLVVYQFDLHQHDEAAKALSHLQELKKTNPAIPDLSALEAEVSGG